MKTFRVKGMDFLWADCVCGKSVPAALTHQCSFGCPYCMGAGRARRIIVVRGPAQAATEWDELDPDDN